MSGKEKILYDKMVSLLKDVADSPTTEYRHGEDDPGACIHCYKVSYKGHSDDCLITRVNKLLQEVQG